MLVNLTPHTLNIECENGEFVKIEPSGEVARVSVENSPHLSVSAGSLSIPTTLPVFGEIESLPEPEDGVIFITSMLVASRAQRVDVLSPGELIRDEDGKPIGCRGLSRHVE